MKTMIFTLAILVSAGAFASAGKTTHLYKCTYEGNNYHNILVKVIHTSESGNTSISGWSQVLRQWFSNSDKCTELAEKLSGR